MGEVGVIRGVEWELVPWPEWLSGRSWGLCGKGPKLEAPQEADIGGEILWLFPLGHYTPVSKEKGRGDDLWETRPFRQGAWLIICPQHRGGPLSPPASLMLIQHSPRSPQTSSPVLFGMLLFQPKGEELFILKNSQLIHKRREKNQSKQLNFVSPGASLAFS